MASCCFTTAGVNPSMLESGFALEANCRTVSSPCSFNPCLISTPPSNSRREISSLPHLCDRMACCGILLSANSSISSALTCSRGIIQVTEVDVLVTGRRGRKNHGEASICRQPSVKAAGLDVEKFREYILNRKIRFGQLCPRFPSLQDGRVTRLWQLH